MGCTLQENGVKITEVEIAYVLLNVKRGTKKQVIKDIKSNGLVKEIYLCFGLYDLILRVETDSMEDLKDFVANKCRKIKNVKSTLTLILT